MLGSPHVSSENCIWILKSYSPCLTLSKCKEQLKGIVNFMEARIAPHYILLDTESIIQERIAYWRTVIAIGSE